MKRSLWFAAVAAILVVSLPAQYRPTRRATPAAAKDPTEGSLYRLNEKGEMVAICPLKHTAVKAKITGYLARVNVTQEFVNPGPGNIEAVYKFPLPPHSAVDDMRMMVGNRTVISKIKPREEARQIYDAARAAGHVASLLDQERPNIFTQSVTNIPAGASVKIAISYVETVPYEDGSYAFTFPMVVGPRYIPKDWNQRVPDAGNIVPRRTPEGTRAGHDLSLEVAIDAGVPL
ncbi:MAG: trypsin, partial [Pyrinomonadaceae bacterium]|nr:trypsin [Phycisphaerales bacterium]